MAHRRLGVTVIAKHCTYDVQSVEYDRVDLG